MATSPKFQEIRTPVAAKVYAKASIRAFGWNATQWNCLETLWTKESNWRPDAQNKLAIVQNGKKVKAGGIPQILGLNPELPIAVQVNRGFTYIKSRYGTPCNALSFHVTRNWY